MTLRRHRVTGRRQLMDKTRTTTTTTYYVPSTRSVLLPLLLVLLLGTGASWGQASKTTTNTNNNINNDVNVKSLLSPSSTSSSSSSSSSCVAADGSLIATTAIIVSTTNEATRLRENLLRCPGSVFEVEWRGSVHINQPLALSKDTSLKIIGSGKTTTAATVHGQGLTALFELDKSSLRLEGLSLTGGSAKEGGAVAARDSALVTLVDCEVYENAATSKGGAVLLDNSRLLVSGTNFTANSADLFGGVISARDGSTVTAQGSAENVFDRNRAKFGGAIYLDEKSSAVFESGKATFSDNSARFNGGVIYAETQCQVTIGATACFTDNEAVNDGGAIFARNRTIVTAAGNTTFADNTANHHGGAIMVSGGSTVVTAGETFFTRNLAKFDGGAIDADSGSSVQLAGTTQFVHNSAGDLGGAVNGFEEVTITAVGETKFVGNSAQYGGALYVEYGDMVSMGGTIVFDNNTAHMDGGALHLTYSTVFLKDKPLFYRNKAKAGSGGAMYCGSVDRITVSDAHFIRNAAVWGGAVATFSSGGQAISSSSSEFSTFDDTSTTSGSTSSASSVTTPVKFKRCRFERNHASEDGGAIYSVAGYDVIRDCNFTNNQADSEGGAIVHAGVVEAMSNTFFSHNGAGNEGPAILSLGMLNAMTSVTFLENNFYCEAGKYSAKSLTEPNECRFTTVCSRCAGECDSELEAGVTVASAATIPFCEDPPEGARTTSRGGTLATLEILPGFFRSSLFSTDVRQCFHKEACQGGDELADYCAPGYGGPYCAVCTEGFAPGYSHTCKSCLGDNTRRAVGVMLGISVVVLVVLGLIAARLVSVVETETSAGDAKGKVTAASTWKEKWRVWRECVRKRFPLTAVKIVVVVWQIVTQYSDVAGVKYPKAYQEFLGMIDLVNCDLGFIMSFACIYDTNFYDRLLMATLGPVVVLSVLGCTYLVALRRNRGSEEAVSTVKSRHLSVALFVIFVVYATVSHTILETFVCDTLDDGHSYLRADYSLTCTTARHVGFQVYAALMVVVYPVGFPCVFGWWLFRHRQELKCEENRVTNPQLRPAADLWEPYRPQRYYYEVVECFRRFALTGLAVFIYPESSAQVAVVLLLAAMFMVVSEILAPFERPVDMWLYRMGHYVVFASMFLALLLRVDVSNEREQSQEVFFGVIIIAHAVMLLVVVAQGLLIFIGWGDLVEVPASLKDPANNDAGDDDCEKGEPGSGSKPGPGGGWGLKKNVDPLVHQEQREKRWETWERVAPTAKSSFFPTPARRRGSGASAVSSRAAFQTASPTSSVHWSEKAGATRGCRSLSPLRRSKSSGANDASGNSSAVATDTRVLAYVEAPPENGERDGLKAAMTAAGFVVPKIKPASPGGTEEDAIDASARTADISASSKFDKTNAVILPHQAEVSSFSRPPAEEKDDDCESPTPQPENKMRTFRSWSPRQRFRSATMAAKATTNRTTDAAKRGRKRTVAGKQGGNSDAIPADTVTPTGRKISDKRPLINAMASAPGTRKSVSTPAARSRFASSPGDPVSSSTPTSDVRTSDAKKPAVFPPAETSKAPLAGVRKHAKRTNPGGRTGGNKPSRTRVLPSPDAKSSSSPPPVKGDSPPARSSPHHQRKVYTPAWRLATTEAAEPGLKSRGPGRNERDAGLEPYETSARGGEQEQSARRREKDQGRRSSRGVGRAAAPGAQEITAAEPGIPQNDGRRTAGELLDHNTEEREVGTENRRENVLNTTNETRNDDGLSTRWRSFPGVATGTEEVGEVVTRPKVRDGWAPRYPLIHPSPTF